MTKVKKTISPNPGNPPQIYSPKATFGEEFYVSSGVYRIIKDKGKWVPEMIKDIKEGQWYLLSAIVPVLEANFGPGNIFCM